MESRPKPALFDDVQSGGYTFAHLLLCNLRIYTLTNLQIIKHTNSMSKIQPLADRVLVRPVAAEEKTVGGIIIPDSAKEKPLRGEVLATGKGTKDEEMVLKAGDQVLYGK